MKTRFGVSRSSVNAQEFYPKCVNANTMKNPVCAEKGKLYWPGKGLPKKAPGTDIKSKIPGSTQCGYEGGCLVPNEVIDEIRSRIDIVRSIGEVVPLKKVGRNYTGLCPFHQEKTPSFTVSDQKQLYHCFGCGEGGTIFTFFMKYHHLSFPETLERLASMAGLDLTDYQTNSHQALHKKEERSRFLALLTYARDLYHQAFLKSEQAAEARRYAISRGLTSDTAKKLHLGYAPASWEALVSALERDHRSLEDAFGVGLLSKKTKGGYCDLFRSRLLFPIQNPKGETVGFGGRLLGDGTPKYLNSPQTILFDKSKLLFGLFEAQNAVREKNHVVVVEGYFDQVTVFENGFENCVATLGTSLTQEHAKLLKKYTDEVIVVFDGDSAGKKASVRSIKPLLTQGLNARVAILPSGFDPDTLVRAQGIQFFSNLVDQSAPILQFFIQEFYVKETDVTKKALAIEELADLVRAPSNPYLREAILEEVSRLTGVDKSILKKERKQIARPLPFQNGVEKKLTSVKTLKQAIFPEELMLLRLAVEVPEVREKMLEGELLSYFCTEGLTDSARRWIEKVQALGEQNVSVSAYVDAWEDLETRPLLAKVFIDSFDYQNVWENVLGDCLKKLTKKKSLKRTTEIAVQEKLGNVDAVEEISSQKIQELKTDR